MIRKQFTVASLIAALQKHNPNALVYTDAGWHPEGDAHVTEVRSIGPNTVMLDWDYEVQNAMNDPSVPF